MIRKKSVLVLLTIIALILLLLSQCTGSTSKPSAMNNENGDAGGKPGKNNEPGTGLAGKSLLVTVSLDQAAFAALQKLSAAYSDTHGGIKVALDNVPRKDAYAELKKASQLGEASDIMLLDNNWVNEFAALGYLQPVDEMFTTEMQARRIPIVLNQMRWNAYLWGIPYDVDPYIYIWNRKTAETAKWTQAPETAEEMVQWNQTFAKPEEGKYGVYFDITDSQDFVAVASALTGVWYDPAQTDKKWAEPATIKALEMFLNPLEGASGTPKSVAKTFPAASASWNPWDQLQKGNIAAMVTTLYAFRQHAAGGIEIASLPLDKGKLAWLSGKSFCISSRTANSAAAMDWIKEMTSAEASAKMWAEAKQFPALAPVPGSALQSAIRSDVYAKKYEWLLENAIVLPVHPETGKNLRAMQTELQRIYKGEQEFKAFAEQMAKLWSKK